MSFESLPPEAKQNHFNLLRLAAASFVIVAHCFATNSPDGLDPLQKLAGVAIGDTAVIAFFAISGYFISLSYERRRSDLDFILARVTRIVPGLLVVSLITAFVVGPLFTRLPLNEYFGSWSVWLYPVQVTSVVRVMAAHLPLVLGNEGLSFTNVSLWTLYYELACYIGLFIAGVAGLLAPRRFAWLLLLWAPTYFVGRYGPWPELHQFAIFSLPFLVGMCVYRFRAAGLLKGWIAFALVTLALATAVTGRGVEELWSIATAFGVLWLGFAPVPTTVRLNWMGDFSYGTYIYGNVVQQIVNAIMPGISTFWLISLSLPLSILCGVASWYLVERPAMRLHKRGQATRLPRRIPLAG